MPSSSKSDKCSLLFISERHQPRWSVFSFIRTYGEQTEYTATKPKFTSTTNELHYEHDGQTRLHGQRDGPGDVGPDVV